MGVAVAGSVTVACGALIATGARTTAEFLVPGELGPSARLIRADFGPAAVPAHRTGYDGQQFYAIARFFPHLHQAANHLDLPRYRLLRIGAPAIASLGGRGPWVVLIMLALNILGIGMAVSAVAAIAGHHGRPQWIAYLIMAPLLEGVLVSTPEPLCVGLALAGVALADRRHHGWAILALTASAFVRESGAVIAVACAAGLVFRAPRPRLSTLAAYLIPASSLAIWWVVLSRIIGGPEALSGRFQVFGFLDASTPSILVAATAIAVSAVGTWYWRKVPVAWTVLATFGVWILIYNSDMSDWLALPRTAAPAVGLGLAGTAGMVARWKPLRQSTRGAPQ